MQIKSISSLEKREKADCLLVPFWQGEKEASIAIERKNVVPYLQGMIIDDFKGESEEALWLYPKDEKEKRILLLGLGKHENHSQENLRRCFAAALQMCQKVGAKKVNLFLPNKGKMPQEELVKSVLEGLFLSNYAFHRWKGEDFKKKPFALVQELNFIGVERKLLEKIGSEVAAIAEGVYLARDLVNENADIVTPQKLVEVAKGLESESNKIKVEIFDKRCLEKEGMGLLLAVNKGSNKEPALIVISYKGKSSSKECVALVGKGITYDTGGLNLKPTGSMETMKCDMAGAAAVLGTMQTIARLGLKVNVTGVVAATENAIGPQSYKPGDVYKGYAKKSVEIGNTDAEGRLILADALAYTVDKIKPTWIIDIATLTGAAIIALGEEIAALFSSDSKLCKALKDAAQTTGENIWEMPLYQRYKEYIKSDIADLKNSSGKRDASSAQAALFLQEFVGKTPWAHLDISSAWLTKPNGYYTTHGTGIGVRLFVELLKSKNAKI